MGWMDGILLGSLVQLEHLAVLTKQNWRYSREQPDKHLLFVKETALSAQLLAALFKKTENQALSGDIIDN